MVPFSCCVNAIPLFLSFFQLARGLLGATSPQLGLFGMPQLARGLLGVTVATLAIFIIRNWQGVDIPRLDAGQTLLGDYQRHLDRQHHRDQHSTAVDAGSIDAIESCFEPLEPMFISFIRL